LAPWSTTNLPAPSSYRRTLLIENTILEGRYIAVDLLLEGQHANLIRPESGCMIRSAGILDRGVGVAAHAEDEVACCSAGLSVWPLPSSIPTPASPG
jgi:hypothetical protein